MIMLCQKSRLLWILLAICFGLAITWETVPLKDSQDRLQRFPRQGFDFVAQNIPVSPTESEIFKNCNLLKLYIRQGKQSYFLTAIDGTNNRNAVHDARLCFLGGGWKITKEESVPVPGGNAWLITLDKEKEGKRKQVMMWFTDGAHRYGSPVKYWIASALRRLTFGFSGEEPIRVIIQPTEDVILNWDDIIFNFFPLWDI